MIQNRTYAYTGIHLSTIAGITSVGGPVDASDDPVEIRHTLTIDTDQAEVAYVDQEMAARGFEPVLPPE
jgi:hypothetical protein